MPTLYIVLITQSNLLLSTYVVEYFDNIKATILLPVRGLVQIMILELTGIVSRCLLFSVHIMLSK